jgi:hypothetical protein
MIHVSQYNDPASPVAAHEVGHAVDFGRPWRPTPEHTPRWVDDAWPVFGEYPKRAYEQQLQAGSSPRNMASEATAEVFQRYLKDPEILQALTTAAYDHARGMAQTRPDIFRVSPR